MLYHWDVHVTTKLPSNQLLLLQIFPENLLLQNENQFLDFAIFLFLLLTSSLSLSVYNNIYIYVCVSSGIYMFVCIHIYIYIQMIIYIYIYIYIYAHPTITIFSKYLLSSSFFQRNYLIAFCFFSYKNLFTASGFYVFFLLFISLSLTKCLKQIFII